MGRGSLYTVQWVESCGNQLAIMDRNWRMPGLYLFSCSPKPVSYIIVYCLSPFFSLLTGLFQLEWKEGSKDLLGMGRQYVGYKLYMPVLPDIINVRSGI